MTDLAQLARGVKDEARLKELRRCQTDLWYLLTAYLGYGWNPKAGKGVFRGKGLTERLHRPICEWSDYYRSDHFMGKWISRWHHKTTMVIGEIIQDYLNDPDIALFYFHAIDDEAEKVVAEVANHLQNNDKLRSLDPIGVDPESGKPYRAFPTKRQKRWAKSDRFTLNRPPSLYSRFPSLLGKGAGSEITGAHANKAYADDIIGRRTIEDNLLPKIKSWWQNTVLPVVDDMIVRVSGTPWSHEGLYQEWWEDAEWRTLVIPGSVASETALEEIDWTEKKIHLEPDYSLAHPVYGPAEAKTQQKRKLRILQRQMGHDFAPQIMCDPSPSGEKPWDREACERTITLAEAGTGPGTTFVLSDPAPAKVGSFDQRGEKERQDGSKNEWVIEVWRVRRVGNSLQRILLDALASREWDKDEGFEEMCRLGRKWVTPYLIYEATGQAIALYEQDFRTIAQRTGTKYTPLNWVDQEGKKKRGLSWTYKGKNHYFAAYSAAAALGEIFVCDSVPKRFLEGEDNRIGGLLHQCRNWRPMANGRNGLAFDDRANCASFVMDPALDYFSPSMMAADDFWEEEDEHDDDVQYRSRYCGI